MQEEIIRQEERLAAAGRNTAEWFDYETTSFYCPFYCSSE